MASIAMIGWHRLYARKRFMIKNEIFGENTEQDCIHYLANAGIMIKSKGKKILIDALNKKLSPFCQIDPDAREKILNLNAPYDSIDLMLFTHHHSDHFDVDTVASFCRKFPNIPVCSTHAVIDQLKQLCPQSELVAFAPSLYHNEPRTIAGVSLEAISLLHAGKDYKDIENLAFILYLGRVFVHTGDAEASSHNLNVLRTFAPESCVFCAPFPYLTHKGAFGRVRERFTPELFYLMHFPEKNEEGNQWIRRACTALAHCQGEGGVIVLAAKEKRDTFF